MAEEKICQGCNQSHRCQEVYEHLSQIEGPGVAFKAVILGEITNSKGVLTAVGFLLALMVSGICILIVKAINRGLIKHK